MVSSGRPGLYVWVAEDQSVKNATDPVVGGWTAINIAAAHNELYPDEALHYSSEAPTSSETTSYTGMVVLPSSNSGGADASVLVSYDRLANGWSPAPFPPGSRGLSALFTMRIDVSTTP